MLSLLTADHLAVVDLSGHGHYLQWGILQISYANTIVILSMILVFALALVLPFPGHSGTAPTHTPRRPADDATPEEGGPR